MAQIVGLVLLGVLLAFALSFIPTALWYCIDDTFAELVGAPQLGELPVTFVYPLCWLVMLLLKASTSSTSSN